MVTGWLMQEKASPLSPSHTHHSHLPMVIGCDGSAKNKDVIVVVRGQSWWCYGVMLAAVVGLRWSVMVHALKGMATSLIVGWLCNLPHRQRHHNFPPSMHLHIPLYLLFPPDPLISFSIIFLSISKAISFIFLNLFLPLKKNTSFWVQRCYF